MVTTPYLPQDRLVSKEVALGVIREWEPPQNHIGLALFAPFQDVASDEAIFEFTRGLTAGLAPARAEDAESELAQKDDSIGIGRASLIDWALKDHYDPSDVSRYRENLVISDLNTATQPLNLPLTAAATDGFVDKVARDTKIRRRKLDNRIEWLITQAVQTSQISYNDGRILFTVDYGRPLNQGGKSTPAAMPSGHTWDDAANADPIGDILSIDEFMYNSHGVHMGTCIISRRILVSLLNLTKFQNLLIGSNPLYTVSGWGYQAALDVIAKATNVNFIEYDSVYRTRALGTNQTVNNRFIDPHVAIFLPDQMSIDEIDDAIGFGKTLTAPHPEGNWTPGFYEWEQETIDPWGRDVGTGIKAFPVLPHLNLTFVAQALAPTFADPITGTKVTNSFTMPPY